MVSLPTKLHTALHEVRTSLTPLASESAFLSEGTLTPEEFVIAGDALVAAAPTWKWAAAHSSRARDYLPSDRQMLVTHGVPSFRRVEAVAATVLGDRPVAVEGIDSGDWVEPAISRSTAPGGGAGRSEGRGGAGDDDEVTDLTASAVSAAPAAAPSPALASAPAVTAAASAAVEEDDEYADLASFANTSLLLADPAAVPPPTAAASSRPSAAAVAAASVGVHGVRRYDLYLLYDKYYRCPRAYLYGYDEAGKPLDPRVTIEEDVWRDLVRTWGATAAVEEHPLLPATVCVAIHPCRHAATMKRIVADLMEGGGTAPSVKEYIPIMLKFLASAVPTIDFDFTSSVRAANQ